RELVTIGEDVYTHDAVFTDCDLEQPHYHFGAANMKVVRDNVLVARDVTLRFGDVPVLWLPFFVQSLASGRRSGLLTPRVSINDVAPTSNSYARQVDNLGFYWAISDHLGAETAFGWRSDDFTRVRGRLEYRYNRQFLSGAVDFSNFWQAEGGTNFTLSTSNSWKPDERTDLRVSGDYASNTRFIERRTLDPRELTQTIRATAGASRRFDWGSMQVNGSRTQYLSDGKVLSNYPSASLTLTPITLFEALPGEEKWYSNATWSANGDASIDRITLDELQAPRTEQESRTVTAGLSSSFSLGAFSLSQSFNLNDATRQLRDVFPDTTVEGGTGQGAARAFSVRSDPLPAVDSLVLPTVAERVMNWSTGLNYQQRLIGSTTFTPGLSLRGSMVRNDSTGGATVSSPTRLDFSASLQTDVFGFWPGIGPVERLRHKISPGFSFTYSPKPVLSEEQLRVFSADTLIKEVKRLSIRLSQTFEAKMRRSESDTLTAQERADSLAADTASGPRRLETERPVTILSINTDALVYDFVAARDGRGIQTMEIGNNLQSDLFRGLQISFAHSLFRNLPADTAAGQDPRNPPREFDLHLSRVNASFSLNSDSWIFRVLGLGRESPEQQPDTALTGEARDTIDDASAAAAVDRSGAGLGLLAGGGRQQQRQAPAAPIGSWNASFSYSLSRPRADDGISRDNQMLTANVSLQPTENWGLQWSTGYSFTDSEFTDHILTLTRRMHDWDAYFDFIKAQNGNFSFQFRVNLRANPDVKLDYEQQDLPGLQGRR
ncbi:MAG: putative LPS assembly protein LptD, partial [Longimicrobiales bacterium]